MVVAPLYVDDIAVSTAEDEYWDHFVKKLNEQYSIGSSTINEVPDIACLGMEIRQQKDEGVLHLTQGKY